MSIHDVCWVLYERKTESVCWELLHSLTWNQITREAGMHYSLCHTCAVWYVFIVLSCVVESVEIASNPSRVPPMYQYCLRAGKKGAQVLLHEPLRSLSLHCLPPWIRLVGMCTGYLGARMTAGISAGTLGLLMGY